MAEGGIPDSSKLNEVLSVAQKWIEEGGSQ